MPQPPSPLEGEGREKSKTSSGWGVYSSKAVHIPKKSRTTPPTRSNSSSRRKFDRPSPSRAEGKRELPKPKRGGMPTREEVLDYIASSPIPLARRDLIRAFKVPPKVSASRSRACCATSSAPVRSSAAPNAASSRPSPEAPARDRGVIPKLSMSISTARSIAQTVGWQPGDGAAAAHRGRPRDAAPALGRSASGRWRAFPRSCRRQLRGAHRPRRWAKARPTASSAFSAPTATAACWSRPTARSRRRSVSPRSTAPAALGTARSCWPRRCPGRRLGQPQAKVLSASAIRTSRAPSA